MREFSRDKKRFGGRSERFDRRDSGRFDRDSDRFGKRSFERSRDDKKMHETTCDKCGKRCEVPFKPTGGKPVYCSDCFKKNEYFETKDKPASSSRELEEINIKLDKILKALNLK